MSFKPKILVTRPEHQSGPLCALIAQQDWQALSFPVTAISARCLSADEQLLLQHLADYQYVLFVSANAVHFAMTHLRAYSHDLRTLSCIAVGAATYQALKSYGVQDILMPTVDFNSEAILALPDLQYLHGKAFLLVRGQGGRELLADTLRARGARLDYLEVYCREPVDLDCQPLQAALAEASLAAILVYSADALANLWNILQKSALQAKIVAIPLVVISHRVYAQAKQLGFEHIIIADHASDVAMINALQKEVKCG